MKQQNRPKIPVEVQVQVFFRDHWLCQWCYIPTVFSPAFKYLDKFVKEQAYAHPTAYYDLHWRCDTAPMLDYLAAVIDHVEPYSKGGVHDVNNFVTACNKCNAQKSSGKPKKKRDKPVKGKHGESHYWDGFVSLFLVLARNNKDKLSPSERKWYEAIQAHLSIRKAALGIGKVTDLHAATEK